ncbi:MAG: hypothetical protein CMD16_02170 [Flavobacteriales bacterium]|nr:hypothetical protein [Flavobacteriales bacterium]|tara:strand:- start:64990 stop:65826 length:837 start_codon:yes stop_codon:yes gene_type:complete
MRKPNLFLVGAPKAGTSLLWAILKEHKDIFFSRNPEKEMNYFSFNELSDNSYYKDYKIKNEKEYLNAFKKGKNVRYLADGSVSYFSYGSIPKKLYKFNSEAKIIIIVRDPILRAFSHYKMDKRMGYATKPFYEYLVNKNNKYDPFIHQYIENSLYYKQIHNFLEYFKSEQVLVIRLENIEKDIYRLFNFLEIEPIKNLNNDRVINPNKVPINIISRTLQHNRYLATVLKKIIPKRVVRFLDFLFYKKAAKIELASKERFLLEKYLEEDYKNFNKKYDI